MSFKYTIYVVTVNTMWRLVLLCCLISVGATTHNLIERVQMMQGTYHVLDALDSYTWYYNTLWTGSGFPAADDATPHMQLTSGNYTTYDIFSLTRAKFRSQAEGDIYCTLHDDTSACINNQARGISLVPTRYYGIDIAAPVITSNQTFKVILGPRIYHVHAHWDLNSASTSVDVSGRLFTLHLPDVGGVRLIFDTVSGQGTLYGAPEAFRNYLVGQSLYDIHMFRGGTCGEDASTICPGATTVLNVPCSGHGRCESSCQCICDKAPHEMIMEALVAGDNAPNSPDGVLSVQDNPLRTPYRGDGCEITCPGYDGFTMDSVCSGRGTCGDRGQCICDYGYIGDNCQFTCPGFDGSIDSAELICSKKGSCEVTDISPVSFRSSDTLNRDRFLRALRQFYGRCHPFIADNQRNDATKFPGDTCTADNECSSGFCDANTCSGGEEEPPHMYVGLDIDINVAPVESPADAKRYCSRVETCVGYAGNMIYVGDNINITAGNTRVYIKDPFFSKHNVSVLMMGREGYDQPCRIPSQQVDERPWVYRPFINGVVQKYDESVPEQQWEGLATRQRVIIVSDDTPPTLISTRDCEVHPNFVLRCPSCLCFRSRVQGFYDGPMCEQCARGYATETCKTKCPGFDGKNIETACSGLGLCNMGKEGTGQCLCGGMGGSRSTAETERVLPLYRDIDAPYVGATNDFCSVWVTQSTCEEHTGCTWNRRCLPKRSGGERAVPSPPLLPFEATYFVGRYREFSTFLWPQVTPDIIIDLEMWENGEIKNSDGEVQCRDFPGVTCDPDQAIEFINNAGTVAETEKLSDMCPRDSVDVVKLRLMSIYTSDVEKYYRACCRCGGGQRGHGLPTSALKVASSYDASCQDTWKNDCNTFTHCSDGRLNTSTSLDWTSFRDRDGITPDIGCCACGGGAPTIEPAPCKVPIYTRDDNQACTAAIANAYNEAQCEAECSLDISCFAYQWDGATCAHSSSGVENAVTASGTTCFRKEKHERCAGWGCANVFGVDCTSCNNEGAREGCCVCGGGVDSNAPVVPFRVRPNPRLTAQIYPVSVSEIERRTASKINFPFEFSGVDKIRQQRRLGTSVCPDCPDSDCNKCPNDCALCINGYSAFNCGDLCGTCVLGGTCVSKPTDGVTLCDCPSSSSSERHNCCPNGFVLLSNTQTLTRPNQIGGIAAGLATYGAFSSDADPRSVTYFDGDEDANLISGCYPCPGVTSSAEICMHPFCEDSLVDVPDRCRTENQYRVGYANLWKTKEPYSWAFYHTNKACNQYGSDTFYSFTEAVAACDENCIGIEEHVIPRSYTLCSSFKTGDYLYWVVWEKKSLGVCLDASTEDTAEMRHWRNVYAASSGYASNACHGRLDQCMVDFNTGGNIFEDRTVCGSCFAEDVDMSLAHGRDCQPCGYGEFGEQPTGETFSTTCQSCPSGRGVPGFVGVWQDYAHTESGTCTSGFTDATACTMDAGCSCYNTSGTSIYTKRGFHKAPGYKCVGTASPVACPTSFDTVHCYMRDGDMCTLFSSTSIEISADDTAWVNSAYSGGPCQSCPVGRFNDGTSAMCQTCMKGTFQDEVGQLGCKSCPYGWYTEKGAGVEGHDEASDCISCPSGQFMEERFMDTNECVVCPTGWGTGGDNRWYCHQCEKGQYQFRTLYEWNIIIDAQGVTTMPTNDCTNCPIGRFQANDGAQTCTFCPTGFFENELGSILCKTCDPGTIPNTERNECVDCPAGFVAPSGHAACTQCAPGKYSEGGPIGGGTCKQCETGKYNPSTGAGACLNCLVGTYMDEIGSLYSCKQCEAGKYGDQEGLSTCKACPSNKPGSSIGSTSLLDCRVCEAGRAVGSNGCDSCAVGTYQDQQNQNTCKFCPTVQAFGINQQITVHTYTEFTYQSEMAAQKYYNGNSQGVITTGFRIYTYGTYEYVWDLGNDNTEEFKGILPCILKKPCCYVEYYRAHQSDCANSNYEHACPNPVNFNSCCQYPSLAGCNGYTSFCGGAFQPPCNTPCPMESLSLPQQDACYLDSYPNTQALINQGTSCSSICSQEIVNYNYHCHNDMNNCYFSDCSSCAYNACDMDSILSYYSSVSCPDPPNVASRYADVYYPLLASKYALFSSSEYNFKYVVPNTIYAVDGHILNVNCGISVDRSYTYPSTYTETITVAAADNINGAEQTFTLLFTQRKDRDFKCLSQLVDTEQAYTTYDSVNDIVHCYIYKSDDQEKYCLNTLITDTDGRAFLDYSWYVTASSQNRYSLGSLEASTSVDACGCSDAQYFSGDWCYDCPTNKRNAPAYHRNGFSSCVDMTTTRFRIGCDRDNNEQYSSIMSFTGSSQSYDLNQQYCGSGGDGNNNRANDRINRIIEASPKYNHKATFEIFGESNCQQKKASFTVGCGSSIPYILYFIIDSETYSTSPPNYDGSKFDASCLRVTLETCP